MDVMASVTLNPVLTLEGLRARRQEIVRVLQRNKGSNPRVFGSVARGEAGVDSDVDLLVDMEEDASLLDLCGMEAELEDLLGVSVDVGDVESLRPHVRPLVEPDIVAL
jgi:predicted nucleotidyltransferase